MAQNTRVVNHVVPEGSTFASQSSNWGLAKISNDYTGSSLKLSGDSFTYHCTGDGGSGATIFVIDDGYRPNDVSGGDNTILMNGFAGTNVI